MNCHLDSLFFRLPFSCFAAPKVFRDFAVQFVCITAGRRKSEAGARPDKLILRDGALYWGEARREISQIRCVNAADEVAAGAPQCHRKTFASL
jgi:hypothetical protein